MSLATGYASLLLLAASLAIGPLNVLRGRANPLSINIRRDIGIVAGSLAIAHTVIALQVHLRGDYLQYFFHRTSNGGLGKIRLDLFGFANHFGLIATVILLILLAISNNVAVRKIGPMRWKGIQRWLYAAGIFVIAHGLLYQVVEQRSLAYVALVIIVTTAIIVMQSVGFRSHKSDARIAKVGR